MHIRKILIKDHNEISSEIAEPNKPNLT